MHGKPIFIACLMLALLLGSWSLAVPQQNSEEETEEFVNLGPISFSKNYELPPERNFIIFKIRNNTSNTISNIFGWVYHYLEKENKFKNFHLINNPHRGGIIVKGKPHLSQGFARWRFPISSPSSPPTPDDRYSLRIHSKGIFFSTHSDSAQNAQQLPQK